MDERVTDNPNERGLALFQTAAHRAPAPGGTRLPISRKEGTDSPRSRKGGEGATGDDPKSGDVDTPAGAVVAEVAPSVEEDPATKTRKKRRPISERFMKNRDRGSGVSRSEADAAASQDDEEFPEGWIGREHRLGVIRSFRNDEERDYAQFCRSPEIIGPILPKWIYSGRGNAYTPETLLRGIFLMRDGGLSDEVASTLGVSTGAVNGWVTAAIAQGMLPPREKTRGRIMNIPATYRGEVPRNDHDEPVLDYRPPLPVDPQAHIRDRENRRRKWTQGRQAILDLLKQAENPDLEVASSALVQMEALTNVARDWERAYPPVAPTASAVLLLQEQAVRLSQILQDYAREPDMVRIQSVLDGVEAIPSELTFPHVAALEAVARCAMESRLEAEEVIARFHGINSDQTLSPRQKHDRSRDVIEEIDHRASKGLAVIDAGLGSVAPAIQPVSRDHGTAAMTGDGEPCAMGEARAEDPSR